MVRWQFSDSGFEFELLVGAENNTFGIKGVKDHACFLKEISDAEKIRSKLMDCEFQDIFGICVGVCP